jgi:hypothetical protein
METLEIFKTTAWFDKNEIPKNIKEIDIISYLLTRDAYSDEHEFGTKKVTFEVTIKMKVE